MEKVGSYFVRNTGKLIVYFILILFLLISVMPIVFMILAALKTAGELNDPFALPTSITFDNVINAWTTGRMSKYMLNSIFVAIPRVSVVLLLASLAGYGFGKLKFKGRDAIFSFILAGMMVPIQAMIIPIYYNLQQYGLINTLGAMILPAFGLSMPFACFMMRAFFKDLPDEIMESATIDGCGEFMTWLYIMLPLVKPAVLSLLVFEFMWSWNDFLLPMLMVYEDTYRTLPLGLMYFFGEHTVDQSLVAAGVSICIMPILIIYIIFQRTFITGITAGAVKG